MTGYYVLSPLLTVVSPLMLMFMSMFPLRRRLIIIITGRHHLRLHLQSRLTLQSRDNGPHRKGTLHAAVVGAGAVFQREEPVKDRVTHYLLEVLEGAAEVEGVFSWEGLQNGEDVLFACWCGGGWLWWRGLSW